MFGWFLNTLCKITEVSRLHCVDFNYVFVIKFLIATNQQKMTTKSFTYYHIYFVTILRCVLFTLGNANNNLSSFLQLHNYTSIPYVCLPEKIRQQCSNKKKNEKITWFNCSSVGSSSHAIHSSRFLYFVPIKTEDEYLKL